MKTTVDLSDSLFERAKATAAKEKTTLRALLEEGLRWVLSQRQRQKRFRLRDARFQGKGVQPGVTEGNWEQIEDLIYRGRGS